MLQEFLNDDSAVKDMFHCAPPSSESNLLFSLQFLGLTFQSIKYDMKHDFAGITDEAEGALIFSQLEVALFRQGYDQ
ncbi:hypothetical protein DPMN_109306 [Dreissena polymorpha]|uniref:Uncharacterized protein n=1 Tax=Dreissena polymorpha TaxID=45954 RepID=A0A9D4QMT4_DREPO|nr:hypothetical protein DPMN_109306 [Dreissena polymorpha]